VSRVGNELKRLGPELAGLEKTNRVAILYSNDSHHGIRYMPFSDRVDYMSILRQFYGALFRMNVEADFVTTETEDLSKYKVLLVPPLYVASDSTLDRIARFVGSGGHAVLSFKSGFTNEHSTVRWERAPGPLRKAAGVSYQEFSNLVETVPLAPDPFKAGEKNRASVWAEFLEPETAEVLARYDHPFFGKWAAITRNRFGKGSLTYEGTVLTDELQEAVIAATLEQAGVDLSGREASVRIRHGITAKGPVHFFLNFSNRPHTVAYTYGNGKDLLSGNAVRRGETMRIGPWDTAIVAER
jgi:beta-galactosidase